MFFSAVQQGFCVVELAPLITVCCFIMEGLRVGALIELQIGKEQMFFFFPFC